MLPDLVATALNPPADPEDIPLRTLWILLGFLLLTGLASLVFQRLRFSYLIGLLLLGLACSWLGKMELLPPFFSENYLTENMVLYVFLPALIFEAALSLDVPLMRKNLLPILLMAVPGVVFAALITGVFVHIVTPLGLGAALIFGALISTTDPVAVIAFFKELNAPPRLTMILDGENLFNDATAIVMFGVAVELVSGGISPTTGMLFWAVLKFVWVFAGGFAAGLAVGAAGCLLIRMGMPLERTPRRTLRVLFTICIAYAAFLLAQGVLGLSGVTATAGAGMVVAYWVRTRESDRALYHLHEFWNFAAFFGNSLIFLLLGLTEHHLMNRHNIHLYLLPAVLAAVVVLLARGAMVAGVAAVVNRLPRQEPINRPWQAIMVWGGGLRGALPIGLAVSLQPSDFADPVQAAEWREMIIIFTLSVVAFTLILQGMTIRPAMRRLGLAGAPDSKPPGPADAAHPH